MPPRPDAHASNMTTLQRVAPWIVRGSWRSSSRSALGAPFVLAPQEALWISPALIIAALGGWLGWQRVRVDPASGRSCGESGAGRAAFRGTCRDAEFGHVGNAGRDGKTAQRAARTHAGQAGRRSRDDGQERIPGHDEPRDPHAAQRHHPAARHRAVDQARRRIRKIICRPRTNPRANCCASSTTSSTIRRSRRRNSNSKSSA